MNTKEKAMSKDGVVQMFQLEGRIVEICPYGSGHINDTFRVCCQLADGVQKRYIFQRMNTEVFENPDELMENIKNVTGFLRKKIIGKGGNPDRETLNVVPTKEGGYYYRDEDGQCWRVYGFIEDAVSYDQVEKPDDFYQAALAFGRFQNLLSDFPAETLHETIKDFHNTPKRFEQLKKAIKSDICDRAKEAEAEIAFALQRELDTHILMDKLGDGSLPLRVTHNDTKLNNIMIDGRSGTGICVIDLDTVMPGLAVTDFGDSIRFGANTAAEDETNLAKVSCDLELFELYARGYMKGCQKSLTEEEIRMLPMGAKMMTLECGMRFLTDYLQGDTYFKIHRPLHNLDRCRCQFALVADMEKKWQQLEKIIEDVAKESDAATKNF